MADADDARNPNSAEGIAVRHAPTRRHAARARRRRGCAAGARGRRVLRGGRALHALSRRPRRRTGRRTTRCAARWHHACFSLRSGEALRAPALDPIACWRWSVRARRSSCARSCRNRRPPSRAASPHIAGVRHHRRRRRRGAGRGRHAPPRRLRRPDHDDQRGRRAAVRSAEPVERLSGRPGAGRLDSVATARVLHRAAHRAAARTHACRRSTSAREQVLLESGARRTVRRAADRDRRRSGAPADPGRGRPAACTICVPSRTAAPSSTRRASARHVVVVGASFIGLEVSASLRSAGHRR